MAKEMTQAQRAYEEQRATKAGIAVGVALTCAELAELFKARSTALTE